MRKLVDIYSPSGKEEEIVDFLQGYLKRHGLPAVLQPVDDNRSNLLVMPPDEEVRMALIGHLDTVAAYELDDYGYDEEGDAIFGLGTADMKGGCAAMVEAFISLWESEPAPLPAALCLVVGEEETGDGAEQLLNDYHFPWAVVGEPTDLLPCFSHYGYLEIQLSALGRRMHASLATNKHNPIDSMLRLMLRISRYMEQERPELVYNLRDLFSPQAGFVVPERCEAWLDVHLPPSAPIGVIVTELEEIANQEKQDNEHVDASMRIATIDAGYELPEKGEMVETLKGLYAKHSLPWVTQSFRSHSDANQLWASGVRPILLGPGKLEKAHAPDESVSFEQVCAASGLYRDLLTAVCAAEET